MSAIIVENLGKRYQIGTRLHHDTLRDAMMNRLRRCLPFAGQTPRDSNEADFWALKDVSFSIEPGEVVGIIGRNGAGKSTLLKILSRITEPTTGKIRLKGRVASLLEVGTGFHPELSGRENIFLNGAILGMSRAEIRQKFDEIVAFSEVERFLDTPVKRYSSGMYVRLAFAVAAHLEPEILIIDEVLAVGDARFQARCLGKMRDVAGSGRTVLFVSHNLSAVRALCGSALLFDSGQIAARGTAAEVLATYTRADAGASLVYTRETPAPAGRPFLRSIRLITSSGSEAHETDAPLLLEIELEPAACTAPVINLHLFDANQETVLRSATHFAPPPQKAGTVTRRWQVQIPPRVLNLGDYRISFAVGEYNVAIYEQLDFILGFSVVDTAFPGPGTPSNWTGYCSPKLVKWNRLS